MYQHLYTFNLFVLCLKGNIAKWMKKEGEKLTPGDVLCEVETVGPCFVYIALC